MSDPTLSALKPQPIRLRRKDEAQGQPQLPPIPRALMDAAYELQDKVLSRPDVKLFDKLRAAYAYLDRLGEHVKSFSVCSKGCSACCKADVQVSRLEAEYIVANGGAPALDEGKRFSAGNNAACPFLGQEGECTIYALRPFHCRTHHTLDDPRFCASGESHVTYGSAEASLTNPFYQGLADWLRFQNMPVTSAGLPAYRDIRDWFRAKAMIDDAPAAQ